MEIVIGPSGAGASGSTASAVKVHSLELKADGQKLVKTKNPYIVADSMNYLTVGFEWGDDWKEYAEDATIYALLVSPDGRCLDRVVTDDELKEDAGINLSQGAWVITIHADFRDEDDELVKRVTTNGVGFTVLPSGLVDGQAFVIDIDESTRIVEQALQLATQARSIAEDAAEAADANRALTEELQGIIAAAVEDAKSAQESAEEVSALLPQIEEAIENANDAADNADKAAEETDSVKNTVVQMMQNGDFDGADGVSPTITVTDIENGHRITITDVNGQKVVDVIDGRDGINGKDGRDGIDGINGRDGRDGIDGINGRDGRNGTDGQDGYTPVKNVDYFDGEDGVSPSVTVTEISGGHRVAISDADGESTFDVMDGAKGENGQDGRDGQDGADGQNAIVEVSDDGEIEIVTWVKVAGTALTADESGAVDIPIAGESIAYKGVGYFAPSNGVGITDSGGVYVQIATESQINNRLVNTAPRPISINKLDYAVKSALCDGKGAAYTAAEQAAARARIGAFGGDFELIETITVGADTVKVSRSAEPDGTLYNFAKMYVEIVIPSASSTTNFRITFHDGWSSNITCYSNSATYIKATADISNGRLFFSYAKAKTNYDQTYLMSTYRDFGDMNYYDSIKLFEMYHNATDAIVEGTVVKIYGVRA